jgi:hypothetical protein
LIFDARANFIVHGVSFGETATVLTDNNVLTREDPDVVDQQRFVTLGMSATGNQISIELFLPGMHINNKEFNMKKLLLSRIVILIFPRQNMALSSSLHWVK